MTGWDDIAPRLHDLLDGRLDAAEERELRDLLAREPELARRYQEMEWMVRGLGEPREERAPADCSGPHQRFVTSSWRNRKSASQTVGSIRMR